MSRLLSVFGVLLAVSGAIWIGQGLGLITVIPSFMIGQREWILYGGIAVVAGLALVALGRRRTRA